MVIRPPAPSQKAVVERRPVDVDQGVVPDAVVDGRDWLADRSREGGLGGDHRRGLLGGRQTLGGTGGDHDQTAGSGGRGSAGGGYHLRWNAMVVVELELMALNAGHGITFPKWLTVVEQLV